MSAEVNPNNRRRVRSRQLVGETPKAAGFRGSSQATSAMGSLYGRSNVYVAEPREEVSLWGNVSRTLGNIMVKLERNKTEEDAEAKRLRLKQEALDEEAQRLQGVRVGNDIYIILDEGIKRGEIDPNEADKFAFNYLDQAAPQMGTAFWNAAYKQTILGLERVGLEHNKKIEADIQTNARSIYNGSLSKAFLNTQNVTTEERKETMRSAISFGTQSGISLAQVHQDIFNGGLSAIRQLGMSGNLAEVVTLAHELAEQGIAGSVPPDALGRSGLEVLNQTVYDIATQYDAREQQAQLRDRQNLTREQEENSTLFITQIMGAKTVPELQEFKSQITDTTREDLVLRFGPSASSLFRLVDAQEVYLTTGRVPAGNAEATAELDDRIRSGDYSLIDNPEALNAYADRLTLQQMGSYRSQLVKIRGSQDPDEATLVNSSLARLQGYFNPPPDAGGTPPAYPGLSLMSASFSDTGKATASMTQAGYAVRDILTEAVRKVNPADYLEDPNGLRLARIQAIAAAEDAIKTGKDRRFVEVANTERSTYNQEELALTARYFDFDQDVRNNPEVREKLARTVMSANASAAQVRKRISTFNDPKVRDYLTLRYQSDMAAKSLATATRESLQYTETIAELTGMLQEIPRAAGAGMSRSAAIKNTHINSLINTAQQKRNVANADRIAAMSWQDDLAPQFEVFAPFVVDDPAAAAGLVVTSLPPKEN